MFIKTSLLKSILCFVYTDNIKIFFGVMFRTQIKKLHAYGLNNKIKISQN